MTCLLHLVSLEWNVPLDNVELVDYELREKSVFAEFIVIDENNETILDPVSYDDKILDSLKSVH